MKKSNCFALLSILIATLLTGCGGSSESSSEYSYPDFDTSSSLTIHDLQFDFNRTNVFSFLSDETNLTNYELYIEAIQSGGDDYYYNTSNLSIVEKLTYVDELGNNLSGNYSRTTSKNLKRSDTEYSVSGTISISSTIWTDLNQSTTEQREGTYSLTAEENLLFFTEAEDYPGEANDVSKRYSFSQDLYYEKMNMTNSNSYLEKLFNAYDKSQLDTGMEYSASLDNETGAILFTISFEKEVSNETAIIENRASLSYQIKNKLISTITYQEEINDISDGKPFNTYLYKEVNSLSKT